MLAPMRALAMFLVAMMLALAACGSDSDDSGNQAETSSQATTSTTETTTPPGDGSTAAGTTGTETSNGKKPTKKNPRVKLKPVEPPKEGAATFPAGERATYHRARAICSGGRPRKVGRKYGVKSSNPYKVALAYSKKNAERSAQDAAYAGCLAGFFGLK